MSAPVPLGYAENSGCTEREKDPAENKLAQCGDLTSRVGPIQTVRDSFPDPLEKAALAYHWNPIAARPGQLVRWSAVIRITLAGR